MSEQPLFDIEALRKIDAQPGDTFVLELPIEYAEPDDAEVERIGAKLKSILGEQVKVIIPPPGTKLRRVPGPYYYRRQVQGIEEEIGFATHAEMMAYLKKDEPQVALSPEPKVSKDEGFFIPPHLSSAIQQLAAEGVHLEKTPQPIYGTSSLTWGDVEKLTQDALKWGKEYTEKAAVSALKQAELRILLDGEPVPIGSPAYCTPWLTKGIGRQGQFIVRSGCNLLGRRVRVEHLGDGEAFDAIVTLMTGPGRYLFVSDGAPSPLPVPSLKEANEQHATETAEAVTLSAKPSMRYIRPLSTGVLQGSNDRETWVDLDPTTLEPVQPQAEEPQADESHKVTFREFI